MDSVIAMVAISMLIIATFLVLCFLYISPATIRKTPDAMMCMIKP